MENNVYELLIIGLGGILLLLFIFFFIPLGLFFQATVAGIRISLLELIMMRWRKIPPKLIVNTLITSAKGGVIVDKNELEALYLAGGDVTKVTEGLIYAKASDIKLSFREAAKLNLARKDIIKEITKE